MTYRAKQHYQDKDVVDDYDAARFSSLKGRLVNWREQRLVMGALGQASLKPPARILDLPCGTGRVTLTLAERGFIVTGADVSEAMLARAGARLGGLSAPVRPTLTLADAESLPFPDAEFDAVVSLRLLGHMPPPVRLLALSEFRRVTRRHVVLAYYDRRSLQGVLRRRRRRGIPWHPVVTADIDDELALAGLRRVGRRFLLRFISETVVVIAERR